MAGGTAPGMRDSFWSSAAATSRGRQMSFSATVICRAICGSIMLRPWWRVPETFKDDNNPDILDYVGRGEMQVVHSWNSQEFALTLRHTLRFGDNNRGSARLSWSFPISGSLRGYVEAFSGYGESLIDYNHNATYLGVGLSLLDWY